MNVALRAEHLKRYKDVAALLVKHGRSGLGAGLGAVDLRESADAAAVAADAEALAGDLESLGPTFVKLGQLLSTRSDLLPAPYIEALSRLQDDVEPMPYDVIAAIVEDELGARLSKAFASFDREPLASASLGQVHRARMRDGRPVAVKVQRPDIEECIARDLEAIEQMASFADRHTDTGKRFGFAAMVAEFRRTMLAELDYEREAANLVELGRNLADVERVVVPQPVPDYTTRRVLTMDFVGGRKVTSITPVGRTELDGDTLANQLFAAYLKQVLEDGFFHADPHPGNVYVTDGGDLALLDLGMVSRITPETQDRLTKLLLAIADGDGADAARAAIELGERRDDVAFDEAAFVRRVTTLVMDQQGATMRDLSAGAVIAELSRISGECGLRPAPELTMLGKALLNLDDVARALDPDFRPDEAIRRLAQRVVQRRMLHSVSPSRIVAAVMDAKEFAERLPGRVNKVMDALAEGELTLNVQGIDEKTLMRGMQRLANRVSTALVLAALIVGAAMLMRVEAEWRLFGYPAIAIICFLLAAGGGFALLIAIVWGDRRAGRD